MGGFGVSVSVAVAAWEFGIQNECAVSVANAIAETRRVDWWEVMMIGSARH